MNAGLLECCSGPENGQQHKNGKREVQPEPATPHLDSSHLHEHPGERAAHQAADHRDQRVTPIGATLVRDGQNRVGDAWAKVASRIDGESSRAAQPRANGPYHGAHEVRDQARSNRARRSGDAL